MRIAKGVFLAVCLAGIVLQGCSYPQGQVRRGENRPALIIEGAPKGAQLIVDGINHGEARQYDGDPDTLLIESGSHDVRVVQGQQVLLQREVYTDSGETRVLTLQRK